ncbi:uncharacterized protein LY89DRAFT_721923 [Mollisia scopiformis]|uniref:Uncharacterized protein n=1 Tax=Mollisia scopiformis TaxID=149040 RepID=A0A194WWB3_MOLSC|nr:uncharacterized protein LY89DRAFT_721923 [Mollisia scopiformis]KUJ12258.1 hypothetical protein LY89DRAFT_721923 [Mollisia scopiformis]
MAGAGSCLFAKSLQDPVSSDVTDNQAPMRFQSSTTTGRRELLLAPRTAQPLFQLYHGLSGSRNREIFSAAALMLKDVSTLSVSTRSYRDEVVMADFLRVLPGVENLALLFPELFPVRVRPYLDAMKIRVLRSLRLSHCKATASEFVDLCKIHSRTLKELHFQDLSLMEGHVEPFFESISDILLTWEQFTLKGYLVELENETSITPQGLDTPGPQESNLCTTGIC